ncbi:hypothetical protein FDP41_008398 [Naegleria fowleri]|uniref:Hemerythrin-like domain-containing protein n=1 Tax=Naegleria fowleri TaxID=5763 RepID=A0A6A5BFB7_NAEFO|nr:uncharacterized protein FDP41_008398 [Naegleria fowleri]KAF0973191.1 hypothetical protein FDP41_008398 [Naegleria fowleri]CAG4710459.1 unnamed protein product [Naegleria fowleri]
MVESSILFNDPFKLLINDHDKVCQLFNTFKSVLSQQEKIRIIEQFITEICIHSSIEERYVYPLITSKIRDSGAKMISDRNYLDHQQAKEVLQYFIDHMHTTLNMNANEQLLFNKTVEKFTMDLLDHMSEEEQFLFPKLSTLLTQQEMSELYSDLVRGKENAPTLPHPKTPMKTGTKLLHPITGAMDKLMHIHGETKSASMEGPSESVHVTPTHQSGSCK